MTNRAKIEGDLEERVASDADELQTLLEKLALVPKRTFQALHGYTDKTEQSLRRHGKLPPHVKLGREIYYPLKEIRKRVITRTRQAKTVSVKDLL